MSERPRVLLVGPCPPPHGGISVHVATARQRLASAGVRCRVADLGGFGPALYARIAAHARRGWTVHLHTHGHSARIWAIVLAVAVAARRAPARVLTLHSGLLPQFLANAGPPVRALVRGALARFDRVVAVNSRMGASIAALGVEESRLELLPAWLPAAAADELLPGWAERWLAGPGPRIVATLAFRPEYGLDVLLTALERLAPHRPGLRCLLLGGELGGSDETALRRDLERRGLAERVLATGDVDHGLCRALVARSDLFVRPTLADGDSISVREALAAGVPVVASDVGERPAGCELVPAGDAEALAAKIEAVGARPRRSACGEPAADEALARLLGLYHDFPRRTAGEERIATTTWRRLARMPLPELAYRIAERGRVAAERVRAGGAGAAVRRLRQIATRHREAGSAGAFGHYFRQVAAPRFYFAADEVGRERLARAFREHFPDRLAALAGEAERLADHRVPLLGLGELDLGAEIDWHRDPVTGRRWERRFWADYDLVRDSGAGDPKVILELHRHQHLPRLALASWLCGEERFARAAVRQLTGWIDQNPVGRGVAWSSSLELALRALSWIWTLALLAPSRALDDSTLVRVVASLFAQLEHVRRYPSLYSSPNTHLLGEAAALYVGGVMFGDRRRGRAWRERGRRLLERETARQVGADGVHRELSTWYHAYALDFYLQAAILARRSDRPFAAAVEVSVERMLEALLHLARPDGSLPRLGDDDGGRALALDATSYDRVGDLLAGGALLFSRADFAAAAGRLAPETLWLFGAEAPQRFAALAAPAAQAAPLPLAAQLPEAGYVVHRSGWGPEDSHLVFDCGGMGGLGGGHGHADALSVTLASGGRELLIDPGTYVYNGAPAWRNHFRSARAHNTAVVDGCEPSRPAGTFSWRTAASARALPGASFDELELASGEQESAGLVHRRRLLYVRPDYWLIVDSFRGRGEHRFELFFHLAPELASVAIEPGAARRSARLEARAGERDVAAALALSFHAPVPIDVEAMRGGPEPSPGWVSRRYGEKRPATSIVVRFSAVAPATILTVVAPQPPGSLRRCAVRDLATSGARAVAVEVGGRRGDDLVIAGAEDEEIEAGGCRGRGELFWLRRGARGWDRLLAVEARRFGVDGESLLDAAESVTGLLTGPANAPAASGQIEQEPSHVRHRGRS